MPRRVRLRRVLCGLLGSGVIGLVAAPLIGAWNGLVIAGAATLLFGVVENLIIALFFENYDEDGNPK